MLTNIFVLYCNYTKGCLEIAQSRNYFLDFMHKYALFRKKFHKIVKKVHKKSRVLKELGMAGMVLSGGIIQHLQQEQHRQQRLPQFLQALLESAS